jgi:dTDP-4-dehydrorhamnose reductase
MITPSKSRILVMGAGGQLGRELAATNLAGAEIVALDHRQCDIESRDQVARIFMQHRPHAVINAAAYTAVDKAESEPERAYRTNVDGVRNLAEEARATGARLVHVSTDYVFDGNASAPYAPEATPNPLGVYGASKFEGEQAFAASRVDGAIVRTAWLYSAAGKNFLTTILGMIRSGRDLRIISDQIGNPTSASALARVLLRCAFDHTVNGVLHWTDAGSGSWYDFAVAIHDLALERSIIEKAVRITPIRSEDYPTVARRPAYSVLDSSLLWAAYGKPAEWRHALANVLDGWARVLRTRTSTGLS